ncbi:hypothetical protein SAMN02745130_01298 [Thiothrix eikelboomii]|uniref:Uncharacterized protein n=1 Tax=Thiothrix eikelboomii TaxID=92487 RepID=A0A1T4W9C2_9GAMM|nr:hypothetical protein [Thiothrix eikelboomii]SKA73876.1 hypothetical protein SAMN02745130_01298 [Thiothrix eikelboomii]
MKSVLIPLTTFIALSAASAVFAGAAPEAQPTVTVTPTEVPVEVKVEVEPTVVTCEPMAQKACESTEVKAEPKKSEATQAKTEPKEPEAPEVKVETPEQPAAVTTDKPTQS